MAGIIKCERNHYYDSGCFLQCPHCATGGLPEGTDSEYQREVSRYAQEYLREYLRGSQRVEPEEEGLTEVLPKQESPQRGQLKPQTEDDRKTIGFSADRQKNYFVAGWLVCVAGPDRGHSFNLYLGYNTAGRSRDNGICLMEDVDAAADIHCSIVYEDRNNLFYLVPEESHATYLNGARMEAPGELHSGDILRMGQGEFEFTAFCRGKRKWDRKDMQPEAARG